VYKRLKIIIPTVLFVIFGLLQYFQVVTVLDNLIHDNILVSTRPAFDNIVIVGIDERSINEIGSWPWPRLFIAEAIEQLVDMEAAVIGVNVMFDAPSIFPEYDEMLVRAAERADFIVMGGGGNLMAYQDVRHLMEIDHYVYSFDALARVSEIGFLNGVQDEDGVMRRALTSMRYGDITVHSFPFEVYRAYRQFRGESPVEDIPLDRYGTFPIRYVGGGRSFHAVSLWGVINEEYSRSTFRDAIVLIGPYAIGVGDSFGTSVDRNNSTHSVEINANILQNFLEGAFVTNAPWWVNLLALLVAALVVALLFHWLKPVSAFLITVVLIVALLVGARVAYDQLLMIIRVGDIIVFLVFCYLANLTLGILSTTHEKKHIRGVFDRFVAPEVVNEIISGNVEVKLGGVVKEISALFVDICGFTAFSEANSPEIVVEMINRYLGLTSNAIRQNNGTIDKFIGDATMALFNAPHNVPDHALCAVRAAWAMKEGATVLRQEILKDYGVDLQFRIGINTGTAVVGNMGSEFRMDYTAIGDTINTASRIEANAGVGQIVISEATYLQTKDFIDVVDLGVINVKNKKAGIRIYNVINVN